MGDILVNCIWVFFAEVCLLILSKTFIHSYTGYLLAVLVSGILPDWKQALPPVLQTDIKSVDWGMMLSLGA